MSTDNPSEPTPRPLVIIEFDPKAQRACLEWFLSRLSAKDYQGGAELTVTPLNKAETMFGITASDRAILSTAQLLQMKVMKSDGLLHLIEEEDLASMSEAQKQQLIAYRIDSLQAEERRPLPGYQDFVPDMEKPLIISLLKFKIVSQYFPLHNPEELHKLHTSWIMSWEPYWKPAAVDNLRDYYGEEIAIYFSFVRLLVLFLLPPSLMPLLDYLWPEHLVSRLATMAAFNMVWMTVFLEYWKRTSNRLALRWGTINRNTLERPRPAYFGQLQRSEVTGQLERCYPKWKRQARLWFVSIPAIILCLFLALFMMTSYLWLDNVTAAYAEAHPSWFSPVLVALPGVGYSIILICMNAAFRKLALLLNEFENHRLQSSFDSHYVLKLITFYSINGFVCLFYKAFVLRDLQAVKDTLATLLITSQIVNQVMESIIPLVSYKLKKMMRDKEKKKEAASNKFLKRIDKESLKPKVEGTIDEYIELYLQFGYVCLFSSLLPWAAVCALLNNILEFKTDAFKLCRLLQRPFAKVSSGIGAWKFGFEFLAYLAVATNCGLLFLSPEIQGGFVKEHGGFATFVTFVVFEHALFCLKAALSSFINDIPPDVQKSLAKQEYRTQQAWRETMMEASAKDSKKD